MPLVVAGYWCCSRPQSLTAARLNAILTHVPSAEQWCLALEIHHHGTPKGSRTRSTRLLTSRLGNAAPKEELGRVAPASLNISHCELQDDGGRRLFHLPILCFSRDAGPRETQDSRIDAQRVVVSLPPLLLCATLQTPPYFLASPPREGMPTVLSHNPLFPGQISGFSFIAFSFPPFPSSLLPPPLPHLPPGLRTQCLQPRSCQSERAGPQPSGSYHLSGQKTPLREGACGNPGPIKLRAPVPVVSRKVTVRKCAQVGGDLPRVAGPGMRGYVFLLVLPEGWRRRIVGTGRYAARSRVLWCRGRTDRVLIFESVGQDLAGLSGQARPHPRRRWS